MGTTESKNFMNNAYNNNANNNNTNNNTNNNKNNDDNYFKMLPGDVQKLITRYFTTTESVNKIINAYPEYKERICSSIEILHYNGGKILDKKYVEGAFGNKNKNKNVILNKNIDIKYFKNLTFTDMNYKINIECEEDLEKLYLYEKLKNWKIRISKKMNITQLIDYQRKIIDIYLNINKSYWLNPKICYSSIEIYDYSSFNPYFVYKNGLLGLTNKYIQYSFETWQMLEKRGCFLRGFIINSSLDIDDTDLIYNFVSQHKFHNYDFNKKPMFDTLILNYNECNYYNIDGGYDPLSVAITIISISVNYKWQNSSVFNIEFDVSEYENAGFFDKNKGFKDTLTVLSERILPKCKINISFVDIIPDNNQNYALEIISLFFQMFNINKIYFTPIFNNLSNTNKLYQELKLNLGNHIDKLYIDPKILKIANEYYNNEYKYNLSLINSKNNMLQNSQKYMLQNSELKTNYANFISLYSNPELDTSINYFKIGSIKENIKAGYFTIIPNNQKQ